MVKNHNLYFIFIKSGTGANGKDDKFAAYWQMARDTGLLCSAYHWLWPTTDPTLQANNLISQYRSVSKSGSLPPAVDIEWTWNAGTATTPANELWNKVSPAQRVPLIKEFLSKVEQALNLKPVIYTAASFWNDTILKNSSAEDNAWFATFPLWIADPNGNNKLPGPWTTAGATFRQSHFGENGSGSDPYNVMDQDVYNGNLKSLLNLAIPGLTFMKGFPYSNIVKDMQQQLVSGNFLNDTADGFFGKNTAEAVGKFQAANGLMANGIIDAQTWNKLLPDNSTPA
jgi:hypothetical protein